MGDGGDFCLRDFLRMWHCGCFGIMAAEMLIPINGTNYLLGEKFIIVFFPSDPRELISMLPF
jgi:hypothetical protein